MSIGDSMSSAWHNHPYIIMGLGGAVALYFLWPSSSGTANQQTDPYGQQLAAETALSQSQLAEQAAADINQSNNTAAEIAAGEAAVATSNEGIAQANSAAIVANSNAQAAADIAWTQGQTTDFQAMTAGLMAFGANAESGAKTANQTGLEAYLAGLGAKFSSNADGINITSAAPGQVDTTTSSGVSQSSSVNSSNTYGNQQNAWFGGGGGWGGGGGGGGFGQGSGINTQQSNSVSVSQQQSSFGTSETRLFTPSYLATSLGYDIAQAQTPFTNANDLMGSLWQREINSFDNIVAKGPPVVGTIPSGSFPGQTQPIIQVTHA